MVSRCIVCGSTEDITVDFSSGLAFCEDHWFELSQKVPRDAIASEYFHALAEVFEDYERRKEPRVEKEQRPPSPKDLFDMLPDPLGMLSPKYTYARRRIPPRRQRRY